MAAVCQHHNIPFYVVAPLNVIDVSVPTSKYFMDEKKNASVMKEVGASRGKPGVTVVPAGVALENPAFDRTPAELIACVMLWLLPGGS
jgi:methylthioribose-1-phosphate isomerase